MLTSFWKNEKLYDDKPRSLVMALSSGSSTESEIRVNFETQIASGVPARIPDSRPEDHYSSELVRR